MVVEGSPFMKLKDCIFNQNTVAAGTAETTVEMPLKVAFIQKVLMHLSFLQTDEPYYFPVLEF